MGLPRILFYGVVRVLATLAAALGFSLDYTGGSIFGLSHGWGITALIAFGIAVVLTVIKEIDTALQPRPRVEYIRPSPESTPVTYPSRDGTIKSGDGYFVRLVFQNKAKNPSGTNSTAQKLAAKVNVFKLKDNQIREADPVDNWDGRWANTDKPSSSGDIWVKNAIDLEANGQEATLDIGFRFKGEWELTGWDNLQYFKIARKPLKPDLYSVQVALGASNWKGKAWWFTMNIPDEPQSNNPSQVQIKPSGKPAIHKAGSQN